MSRVEQYASRGHRGFPAGLLSSCALLLAVSLCIGGLVWNGAMAPLMDDSDPSTYIGDGLLLFGAPALLLSLAAVATWLLPRRAGVTISFGIALAALAVGALPVIGLAAYELMTSQTLWSR